MSSAAVAVLYSLATITCWGTVNVVIKNLTNTLGEKSTLYYRGMFSAISSCLLLLAFLNESTFNITYIFYGAFLATFSYIGFYYLVRGLTVGKVGIVVPLNSSARVFVSVLFGVLYFGDTLSMLEIIAIIGILLGVLLYSLDLDSFKGTKFFSKKSGVLYALLSSVIWGIVYPLFNLPSGILGGVFLGFIIEVVGFVCVVGQINLGGDASVPLRKLSTISKSNLHSLIFIGVASALGSLFLAQAYKTGDVNIVSAVTGASALVSIFYAWVLNKEQLLFKEYIAAVLMVASVVILGYFG